LENLREKKITEARLFEEKRVKDEEERIKEWERKFDKEQIAKEEELIKKFNDQLIREKEENEKIIEFRKEEVVEEIIDNEIKKQEDEKY
jgi:hypothetical protein